MTIQELKSRIEDRTLLDSVFIFKYTDDAFIAHQYATEIAALCSLPIEYIEQVDTSLHSNNDLFGSITIQDSFRVCILDNYSTDRDVLYNESNLIVIAKNIQVPDSCERFIVEFPKLENWHIMDYALSLAEGVDSKDIEWLVNLCKYDIHRIHNELDKIVQFEPIQQQTIFDEMKTQGAFDDLVNSTVFDLTNAITSRNLSVIDYSLHNKDKLSIEPMALLAILYQQFRKLIQVWMSSNPTESSTGLSSKMIYAISRQKRTYSSEQLLKVFDFLTNIDYNIKDGQYDMDWLVDYMVLKVLSA